MLIPGLHARPTDDAKHDVTRMFIAVAAIATAACKHRRRRFVTHFWV